ncbi:MAG TPA: carbohydrate binding domain-containing protein [Actinomycetota bacterium]|nr:carbohydrate binding domain-containing protein [Actinomycetota bacterium]
MAILPVAPTAHAVLPSTSDPTLSLARTIRTTPFLGTTTSVADGEGTAYVPRDGSLWLVGDNDGKAYEVDPFTGALKRTINRTAFENAPQYGGGPLAGRHRSGDLEALAYDEVTDTLYAFSGTCCTSTALPTVFRLTRDPISQRLDVDSYQPLASGSDFPAAAWSPVDGTVYVGKGRVIRRYDYASNSFGPQITLRGVPGIYGLDFSATGADLMVVTSAERMYRVAWATKTVVSGWTLDLTPFGVKDSRAVEVIPDPRDPSTDQLYVYDGYDARPAGDPLRYAVFVFDVTGAGGQPGTGSGNLVGNPGFESGTSGWTGNGVASLSRVSGGHESSYAARLANAGTTSGMCTLNDSPNWVASTGSATYTASMWVRADAAGATLKLRIREYDGSTLVGTPAVSSVDLTSDWQHVSVQVAPQSSGHTLDLTAFVSNAPPGTCFYADDVSVTSP